MGEIFVDEEIAMELFDKLDAITLLLTVISFLVAVLIVYLFIHFSIDRGANG